MGQKWPQKWHHFLAIEYGSKKWSKNDQKWLIFDPFWGLKKGSVDPQGSKKLGGKLFGGSVWEQRGPGRASSDFIIPFLYTWTTISTIELFPWTTLVESGIKYPTLDYSHRYIYYMWQTSFWYPKLRSQKRHILGPPKCPIFGILHENGQNGQNRHFYNGDFILNCHLLGHGSWKMTQNPKIDHFPV